MRRAFAGVDLAQLDPFVHMDQMGEVEYGPGEPKGTAWHPHRGFETVTYMIDGTFQHQDSAGGGGVITNGDTQWMTAGSGILHIERPPEALVASGGCSTASSCGSTSRRADKWVPPRYQDIGAGKVALRGVARRWRAGARDRRRGGGARRAGRDPHAHGHGARHGQPRGPRDAALGPATTTPCSTCSPARGRSGTEGRPVRMGQLAVFGAGDTIVIVAARDRQERARPSSTCSSSAAGPSASRW